MNHALFSYGYETIADTTARYFLQPPYGADREATMGIDDRQHFGHLRGKQQDTPAANIPAPISPLFGAVPVRIQITRMPGQIDGVALPPELIQAIVGIEFKAVRTGREPRQRSSEETERIARETGDDRTTDPDELGGTAFIEGPYLLKKIRRERGAKVYARWALAYPSFFDEKNVQYFPVSPRHHTVVSVRGKPRLKVVVNNDDSKKSA